MTKSQGELVEADNVVDELELQDSGSGAAQKEKVVAEAKTGDQLAGIMEKAKENVVAEAKTGDQLAGIVEKAKENVEGEALFATLGRRRSIVRDSWDKFMRHFHVQEKTALTILEGYEKNHFFFTVDNTRAAAPAIENNAAIENNPADAAAIENNPAVSPNI